MLPLAPASIEVRPDAALARAPLEEPGQHVLHVDVDFLDRRAGDDLERWERFLADVDLELLVVQPARSELLAQLLPRPLRLLANVRRSLVVLGGRRQRRQQQIEDALVEAIESPNLLPAVVLEVAPGQVRVAVQGGTLDVKGDGLKFVAPSLSRWLTPVPTPGAGEKSLVVEGATVRDLLGAVFARSVCVLTLMPAVGVRMQLAASTRSPSISTMQARQLPSAR